MFQFFSLVFKFVTASILVGAGLTAMNLDAERLLEHAGVTPEQLAEMSEKAMQWLIPNMTLGAVFVLPLWLLATVLRPPRDR